MNKIIVHENFTYGELKDDLALLRLGKLSLVHLQMAKQDLFTVMAPQHFTFVMFAQQFSFLYILLQMRGLI